MKAVLRNKKRDFDLKNPVVLITGDGRTLHKDLADFLVFKVLHDVIAIGRSIKVYPGPVGHWANVDGADSKWWGEHLPGSPVRHSMGDFPWYDVDWDVEDEYKVPWEQSWNGSTALFAVLIALAMGYEKVVLAGCPLDSRGHWWQGQDETPGPRWTGETYQAWFEFMKTESAQSVRSMSGYTAQMLGMPSKEGLCRRVDRVEE